MGMYLSTRAWVSPVPGLFGGWASLFSGPFGDRYFWEGVCLGIGHSTLKTWDLGYNGIRSASGPYASYCYGLLFPTDKNTADTIAIDNKKKINTLKYNRDCFRFKKFVKDMVT